MGEIIWVKCRRWGILVEKYIFERSGVLEDLEVGRV